MDPKWRKVKKVLEFFGLREMKRVNRKHNWWAFTDDGLEKKGNSGPVYVPRPDSDNRISDYEFSGICELLIKNFILLDIYPEYRDKKKIKQLLKDL